MKIDPATTADLARRVRAHALRMTHKARASHIGSCLSVADILAVLYGSVMKIDPGQRDEPSRDRLIMSKGHAAAALYAVLAESGFFPKAWLDRYCEDDQPLAGHISHKVPGVEASTGSLGHGLSIGCGLALGGKAEHNPSRVFVVLSDGECDEGAIWEAALFAPHHHLDNLVAVIDFNHIQSFGRIEEVLNLAPLSDKWQAFGWTVIEVDGHDHEQLLRAFAAVSVHSGKPTVVIAQTVKGKGVSFMEDQLAWHYRSVDDQLLEQSLIEVEGRS